MFRKIAFALAATAALGAAALAPTSASAHRYGIGGGGYHHMGGFGGGRFYGPHRFGSRWPWGVGIAAGVVGGAIAANSCYRREMVDTPYGPDYRWVNICY